MIPPEIETLRAALRSTHNRDSLDRDPLDRWGRGHRRPAQLPGQGRQAAVLCLIFPLQNNWTALESLEASVPLDWEASESDSLGILLTRRAEHLGRHAGQISFPGGRQDPGESLEQTAKRETWEEVGLPPVDLDLLGPLLPVYVPPTDFTVTPFVAWCPRITRLVPDVREVDRLIVTSVESLRRPETLQWGKIAGQSDYFSQAPFFQIGQHQVWGATGRMISDLISRPELSGGGHDPH